MIMEKENTILTYFFKKSLCGMILCVRVTSKNDTKNSTVIKCNEEQTTDFLLQIREK